MLIKEETEIWKGYVYFRNKTSNNKFPLSAKLLPNNRESLKDFWEWVLNKRKDLLFPKRFFHYLTFTFQNLKNKGFDFENLRIFNLDLIFGENSRIRYLERSWDEDWKYEIDNSFLISEYKINRNNFLEFCNLKEIKKIETYDSPHRAAFLNKEEGLAYCMLNTTLFDPSDSSCKNCKVRSDCKIVLKAQFPILWEQRVKNRNNGKQKK
jgi:hypothetical protein